MAFLNPLSKYMKKKLNASKPCNFFITFISIKKRPGEYPRVFTYIIQLAD